MCGGVAGDGLQKLAAAIGIASTIRSEKRAKETRSDTKKEIGRRAQETAKVEAQREQDIQREEQIQTRDIQRQKKQAQAAQGTGRGGTILTGRGATPGTTTGSSTSTATQKTLLGL